MRAFFAMALFSMLVVGCTTSNDPPPVQVDARVPDGAADVGGEALLDSTGGGPAAACVQYLACVAVVDAANLAAKEAEYGAESTCWSGDGDASTGCAQACSTALAALLAQNPLEEACGGCNPANDPSCSIVGEPCVDADACETDRCLQSLDNPQVLFDGGYCTQVCVIGEANTCPAGSSCGGMVNESGLFNNRPYCFRLCNGNGDCRSGYECKRIPLDDQGALGEKGCQPSLK